ncbi:elongation of very long chain fatty acids protein [Nesidiocoris tenuis]|uniref:Elongation of very long chain fatty acids protein n=1 Tax=Nesidiocoris tenuis TaxID=355587 RepID=A0ABN7AUC8_9HEMI|nr:elongation of very long chain fatty acids protein [Nesidiocoris tenuis]
MTAVFVEMYASYSQLLEENVDPRVKHLPLVSSPLPMVAIVLVYHAFINVWGPAYMKDRQPFQLRQPMIIYNAIQVLSNALILCMAVKKIWFHESFDWTCNPPTSSEEEPDLTIIYLCYAYYMMKILDLTDTVFMVLRKKDRQISFLHTYHHMGMCLAGWIGTALIGGGTHLVLFGSLNCLVHTIMYGYYLLAIVRPEYTSAKGKRRITELQLTQFTIFFFHGLYTLLNPNCKFPTWSLAMLLPQDVFMFVLFWDFYVKAYLKPSTPPKKND